MAKRRCASAGSRPCPTPASLSGAMGGGGGAGRRAERRQVGEEVLVERAARAVKGGALRILRVLEARDARVHERERVACAKGVVLKRGPVDEFKRPRRTGRVAKVHLPQHGAGRRLRRRGRRQRAGRRQRRHGGGAGGAGGGLGEGGGEGRGEGGGGGAGGGGGGEGEGGGGPMGGGGSEGRRGRRGRGGRLRGRRWARVAAAWRGRLGGEGGLAVGPEGGAAVASG